MGYSVRVGAELDVLVSASGRVLLAFQDRTTRQLRLEEALVRRPDHADPQIDATLETIRTRGFASMPSVQVRGLYAVSFPILAHDAHAIAALTVPYAERVDQVHRVSIATVEATLGVAARGLSRRMGSGDGSAA
jgi:DNA-binding IclR family transcriptional regulator